jgi:glutaredoxin
VIARDVSSDTGLAERLQSIRQVLKLPQGPGPVVYGLSRAIHQAADEAEFGRQMDRLLLIELYSRPNCPHCDQADQHLKKRLVDYPALRLVKRDVSSDSQAQAELQAELRRRNSSTATVPVLALANQLLIGFDQQQKSGDKIDAILQQWSVAPKRGS